jgi:hypothetical protein
MRMLKVRHVQSQNAYDSQYLALEADIAGNIYYLLYPNSDVYNSPNWEYVEKHKLDNKDQTTYSGGLNLDGRFYKILSQDKHKDYPHMTSYIKSKFAQLGIDKDKMDKISENTAVFSVCDLAGRHKVLWQIGTMFLVVDSIKDFCRLLRIPILD